ncbi:maleylpyruvate isomerase family mycothiol-dependent enzyme [Sphaerisporangium sp. B11E5]|uniref:maleylpyruvate isomerase family mycothiol-dependent enzyme n=1 Tax=Sphaerisporangium sp. B11E5 TaxID=3153563 RepID=UPI00325D087D
MTIFDDLAAEQDRLESVLEGLTPSQWLTRSSAEGWTVADVVLHLAQTEEVVTASVAGVALGVSEASGIGGGQGIRTDPAGAPPEAAPDMTRAPGVDGPSGDRPDMSRAVPAGVDEFMDRLVADQRAEPAVVFDRWRTARRAALAALRSADPRRRLEWVAAPMSPAALATTRLAEHWAHGLDITIPLGIDLPDTPRLRHVAWLAHRTLPYALALAGEPPHEIRCELTSPDGTTTWTYGPPDADSSITGPASTFCRIAAQRLPPDSPGLTTTGPHAATALRHLRTYAA